MGWKAKANGKEADDDNDDGPMVQYGGIVDDDETDEVIEAAMQARAVSGKKTTHKVKLLAFI